MAATVQDWQTPICILSLEVDLTEYSNEPSAYVRTYEGHLLSGEDDANQAVGEIAFSVVELSRAAMEGVSPWDVLDSIDQALAYFMALVTLRGWRYVRSIQQIAGEPIGGLLVVDHIAIEPAWRGQRLGLIAIDIACERFRSQCSLAALRAFPTQWEGRVDSAPAKFRNDRRKLMAYYSQAGFLPVLNDGIMVRPLAPV